MTLCFATNNQHKLEEVRHAVANQGVTIVSLQDIDCQEELPETRDTLEGNSLQKAEYLYEHYAVPCFADDTGLEVDALNGEPGVYSARYAGSQRSSEDNINLLLKQLSVKNNRRARFRTVITLLGVDDKPLYFEGIIKGVIATKKSGDSGFGYDPVFIPEGQHRTFAEMSLSEKNQLSHRALAIAKLQRYLQDVFLPLKSNL